MESIEFINRYKSYLDEISEFVKTELLPTIDELKGIDPNDLVRLEGYFESVNRTQSYEWNMFTSVRGNILSWNKFHMSY